MWQDGLLSSQLVQEGPALTLKVKHAQGSRKIVPTSPVGAWEVDPDIHARFERVVELQLQMQLQAVSSARGTALTQAAALRAKPRDLSGSIELVTVPQSQSHGSSGIPCGVS